MLVSHVEVERRYRTSVLFTGWRMNDFCNRREELSRCLNRLAIATSLTRYIHYITKTVLFKLRVIRDFACSVISVPTASVALDVLGSTRALLRRGTSVTRATAKRLLATQHLKQSQLHHSFSSKLKALDYGPKILSTCS